MGKSKTASYIVTYPLRITRPQQNELSTRFFHAQRVYNCMVKEANRRINFYYLDPQVKEIRKRMRKKGYKLTDDEKEILKNAREAKKLREYDFHNYLITQTRMYDDLDAFTVQKIGTAVWSATRSVLFGKGKTVHFKKYEDLFSLEGKTNTSGIRFVKDIQETTVGTLIWGNLRIPVGLRKHDLFALEALNSRVKYCRIVRFRKGDSFQYSLQLVLEGKPPAKRKWRTGEFRHHPSSGNVGLDPGTSTIAAVSVNGVILREYGDDVEKIDRMIAVLQRKLDRQRRAANPQNYRADGQIKRLKKGEKRIWYNSRNYYDTLRKLRRLYRRRAAQLKESQCELANWVLDNLGINLFIEQMNFSALQKRAKKTQISTKTGRPRSKKRFGRSILCHAPGKFITIISQKAKSAGGFVVIIDPAKVKGSQYNHLTDEYVKVDLSVRWKELISGILVQRDLYSAFLHSCCEKTTGTINKALCRQRFSAFLAMQDKLIKSLREEKAEGKVFPSCMGI